MMATKETPLWIRWPWRWTTAELLGRRRQVLVISIQQHIEDMILNCGTFMNAVINWSVTLNVGNSIYYFHLWLLVISHYEVRATLGGKNFTHSFVILTHFKLNPTKP